MSSTGFLVRLLHYATAVSLALINGDPAQAKTVGLTCTFETTLKIPELTRRATSGDFSVVLEYEGEEIAGVSSVFDYECLEILNFESAQSHFAVACTMMLGEKKYSQSFKLDRYTGGFVKFFGLPDASSGLMHEGTCVQASQKF